MRYECCSHLALQHEKYFRFLFAYGGFLTYFFSRTNAKQRLERNVSINVNTNFMKTGAKASPFSAKTIFFFISYLQRLDKALT